MAQQIVSGVICDLQGNPLPDVTVSLKNKTVEVKTNSTGFYSIEVPEGETELTYQKTGYQVQNVIIDNPVINLVMTKDVVDVFDLSLEELMNIEITVVGNKPSTLRETPGIITVITEDYIQKSGARDVIDLFQLLVPGFEFGADCEGAVGDGFRGMWGFEGKILFMLDGQECNDGVYGNTVFGNHYTLENIEKIEIIRGPGSAIYGGFAGIAVVNIITKGAEMNGGYVSSLNSVTGETFSHRNINYGFGKQINDFKISVTGVHGYGSRSERDNIDYYGNSLSMKNRSELNINNTNLYVSYKGLDLRYILDFYNNTNIDLWGQNFTKQPLNEHFNNQYFQLKYTSEINENFSIIPKIRYKIQNPFNLTLPDDTATINTFGLYSNKRASKCLEGSVSTLIDISRNTNIMAGIEIRYDKIERPENPLPGEEYFVKNIDTIANTADTVNFLAYKNMAIYAQFSQLTQIGNFTLGLRFDNSSEFESSVVPRFSYTKILGAFHVKAMFSQSFRTPNGILPNRLAPGDKIIPEKATNYELELGYRISDNSFFVINGYNVVFDKIIVAYNKTGLSRVSYRNSGKLGTMGLETEYRYIGASFDILVNYSYYRKIKDNEDVRNVYGLPEDINKFYLQAFAAHKANLLIGCKISKNISFYPSLNFFGKRYGYVLENQAPKEFNPTYILNLNIRLQDLFIDNFDVDLGIRNIIGEDFSYINPYNSEHAPLPGLDRAVVIKLSYRFNDLDFGQKK